MIRLFTINLFVLLLTSCTPTDTYVAQTQAHLRIVEREDHQKCVSQGIDFGDWNDVSTELYWRCRYNLVQSRFIHDATTSSDIRNNAIVKKISNKIIKNLTRSRQAILSNIEDNLEAFDHSKCLSMGYSLDSNNQYKNEKYYECRKKLVYDRVPAAPSLTNSYEAAVLPISKFDQYVDNVKKNKISTGEVDYASSMINRYPLCRNINVKSKYFKQCHDSQEESFACLSKIVTLKAKKQLNDRLYCQQQAFIQFPDNYSITRNKSAKEIERILQEKRDQHVAKLKRQKEAKVNRTLQFFQEGHISQDILFKDQKNTQEKQGGKEILYQKIQILELREEFIYKCNGLLEQKLPTYVEEQTAQCLQIGKDWDKKTDEDLEF
jgi:hypothetical protein